MATEEIINIQLTGDVNSTDAWDLIVRFPHGSEEAVMRIPRSIVRADPQSERVDVVATLRLVGAFLTAVQIPAWLPREPGPRR